jgi:hypothetical protein
VRSLIKITLYLTVVILGFALFSSSRRIAPEAYRDRLANAIFARFSLMERVQCAQSGHRSSIDLDTLAFTVATADVESYARPRWMRFLQYLYAMTNLRFLNRIPDLSIGPAQIRLSNIRQIAKPQGTRSEWLNLVSDECVNMSIAYCFAERLRGGRPWTQENIAALAQSYNGQRRSVSTEGSLQYVYLVAHISSLIRVKLENWQGLDAGAEATHRHVCM